MGFIDQSSGGYSFIPSNSNLVGTKTTEIKTPEQLINDLRNSASKVLNSQFSSVSNVFDKAGKSLAASVSKQFSGVFGETTVPSAATPTTQVSDPVSTLLKTPFSKTFKLDSMQSGSGSVGGTGSVSQSGTLSDVMIGTQLSTILNRFSLDNKDALGSVINTKSYQDRLNGLFGTFSVQSDVLGTNTPGIANSGLTVDSKSSVFGIAYPQINVSEAIKDINDIQNVTGSLDPSLFKGTDVFSFYTQNVTNELVNENGDIVSTSQPVSASSANSVLGLIKRAGCYLANGEYKSIFDTKSFFNLGMITAAGRGMLQELTDLVACSQSSTPWGQQTLKEVFTSTANTDLEASAILIGGIADTTSLEVSNVDTLVFTNPDLDKNDATLVASILNDLNSSPSDVLTVKEISTDAYPVWDASIMSDVQPSFMNAILQKTDMTTYLGGASLSLNQSGQFV